MSLCVAVRECLFGAACRVSHCAAFACYSVGQSGVLGQHACRSFQAPAAEQNGPLPAGRVSAAETARRLLDDVPVTARFPCTPSHACPGLSSRSSIASDPSRGVVLHVSLPVGHAMQSTRRHALSYVAALL